MQNKTAKQNSTQNLTKQNKQQSKAKQQNITNNIKTKSTWNPFCVWFKTKQNGKAKQIKSKQSTWNPGQHSLNTQTTEFSFWSFMLFDSHMFFLIPGWLSLLLLFLCFCSHSLDLLLLQVMTCVMWSSTVVIEGSVMLCAASLTFDLSLSPPSLTLLLLSSCPLPLSSLLFHRPDIWADNAELRSRR